MKRLWLALVLLWGTLGNAGFCSSHPFNNGYTYIHVHGNTADVRLLLPFMVMLQYDTNHNQAISTEELQAQKREISAYMESRLQLFNNLRPMSYSLVDMKSIIQEETEDPMVELNFRFEAESPIENMDVVYDVILTNVDPEHQNFIQIFNEQGKVEVQRVADKYDHKLKYVKGGEVRFPARLLALFVVIGVQHVVENPVLLLFAGCLALPTVRLRTLLETTLVFAVANLLGCIVSFRSGYNFPAQWAGWLDFALILYCAIDLFRQKTLNWRKYFAALLGGVHGLATFSYLMGLGVPSEYKIIFLTAFVIGILLAFAGFIYVLYTLLAVLRRWRWYRRAVLFGATLIGLVNLLVLVSM